jgi:hypothetical protein
VLVLRVLLSPLANDRGVVRLIALLIPAARTVKAAILRVGSNRDAGIGAIRAAISCRGFDHGSDWKTYCFAYDDRFSCS